MGLQLMCFALVMQKYNTCPTEVEQLNLEIVVTGEDRQAQQEVLQASIRSVRDLLCFCHSPSVA